MKDRNFYYKKQINNFKSSIFERVEGEMLNAKTIFSMFDKNGLIAFNGLTHFLANF